MSETESRLVDPYREFGFKRVYSRITPGPLRYRLGQARYRVEDAAFPLTRQPPRQLRLSISPDWFDFRQTGRDQLEFFVELAGLLPSDRFLDIACGIGRIALPLTGFLDSEGSYEGFDTERRSIDWCTRQITSRDRRFGFKHADVRTDYQNPSGADPVEYSFEYDNDEFDFIYAGSIFTHLTIDEAANYLNQANRVARRRTRFVATWLTYDDESCREVPGSMDRLTRLWPYVQDGYRIKTREAPGESVAYSTTLIRKLYAMADWRILEPFRLDASYCPTRIPSARELGTHLYYAQSLIAFPGNRKG